MDDTPSMWVLMGASLLTIFALGLVGWAIRRLHLWVNPGYAAEVKAQRAMQSAGRPMQSPVHGAMHNAMQPMQSALQPVQRAMQPAAYAQQDARTWLDGAAPLVQSINLSTLVNADNVLVAGPKGSGKTTVLRTLLANRADAETIAVDPHSSPGKWPCISIGGGLEWSDISKVLQRMQGDMQTRFGQLARGEISEGRFPRRTYVNDEWLVICQELNGKGGAVDAGKSLISRLTQGRKVGECVFLASQNDTVEALGIQGNADLKGCFDYIIYLGSLVSTRAKYHGCPPDIMEAAKQAERVGVVWHPERNNWYVLKYDLQPVREGQVLSVSGRYEIGTPEPVRAESARTAGTEPSYQYGTGTVPAFDADALVDLKIKTLHDAGVSWNKIGEQLGLRGQKQQRNARIRQALGMPEPANAELVEAEE